MKKFILTKEAKNSPGIHWIRHITIVRLKDGSETHFIKWVKVYEKGSTLPLNSVAQAAKEIMDKKIYIPITEILVEEPV